ncbi:ImmA/IrrE family metallo-endopeptidase [Sporolactobacillus kofuensis]|uniref:ImmA/IrrE family metallo-endopeptidase n=1 Tax=Sporolactobacillus kofuensis TaxID=269672 RepID=A0ABW1WCM8_9BACL|nr:ImmA/IrrE family metallo-endopeptidase [Sporolactobacillus kofuensis]MCO7177054.1 ImmA/IrrE family metallo-endopeptidase [Sporolactobacillus kofuensis]
MDYVSRCVKDTVTTYKTSNPFEIASQKGIIITESPLGETLGFYMMRRRTQFITLNSDMNHHIKRFVCAHELGHAIEYPLCNTSFLRKTTLTSINKIEVQANKFATLLLAFNHNFEPWMTKRHFLQLCGIPIEMERFI